MFNALLGPVTGVVSDVIKRLLPPEKMGETERAQLNADVERSLRNLNWKELEKEIEDRANARMLAQQELKNANATTAFLAALHRPCWSFVTLGIFTWTIISPHFGLESVELTDIHKSIMQTVIFFYFGGRSVEKCFKEVGKRSG